jgi:hypothetical protein
MIVMAFTIELDIGVVDQGVDLPKAFRWLLHQPAALAWLAVVARIADPVSFYPEKVTITIA